MKKIATSVLALALLALASAAAAQCVSLPTIGAAVTEDFNTLANTGTTNTATPTGWYFLESLANANTNYRAGTGSDTNGDTYSFGSAASTDRAFGHLQSGTLLTVIGACFTNNTGIALNSLLIGYTGEQWRQGGTSRFDRMDFQYSLDATSLGTGTWTDVNPLDFTAPNGGPVGNLVFDGNLPANRTVINNAITGLNVANGATVWIRWVDFNAGGADDGLGVDDFSLTPMADATPTNKNTWGRVKTLYR
jgi:hypothetical protein